MADLDVAKKLTRSAMHKLRRLEGTFMEVQFTREVKRHHKGWLTAQIMVEQDNCGLMVWGSGVQKK